MKTIYSVLLIALAAGPLFAQQDANAVKYAATINADDLKRHLTVLASDEYEGRETGMAGQKKAAEYIMNHFKGLGIPPLKDGTYYQSYGLEVNHPGNATFSINGQEYKNLEDFYFFSSRGGKQLAASELVFLGYGIDDKKYSDYDAYGESVKGKVLLVLDGEPIDKAGNFYVSGSDEPSKWTERSRQKGKAAAKKGAAALLVIVDDMDKKLPRIKPYLTRPSMRLLDDDGETDDSHAVPRFFISRAMAMELMAASKNNPAKVKKKIDKKGEPVTFTCKAEVAIGISHKTEEITAENVLGFIEGSDPKLKHEIVVVTAHYDHLGTADGEVFNGADDDGSGTVSALEIAEAFMEAKRAGHGPRRSVLIMPVSGEEKGLLGSKYYSDHPIYPLENTVADLNIDMVGRVDKEHKGDPNYVYIIGSDKLSSQLHKISEDANATYTKLALDYTYNEPDDPNRYYYRSDHYNFAKNDIPVIFYFTGVHEDYHKPTDTVDKIMFDKLTTIAQLVFYTAWELANRDETIEVDMENDFED